MNRLQLIAALLLACCGPVLAADPPAPPPAMQPSTPAPGQMDESSNYIVGPGDTIQVFVWRNPELSVTVPVRPDGKVSTPLVEDIVAVGQTPSSLARLIEQRLSEYVRSPQVNVIVTNAQSTFSKVTVIGQVRTPQAVPFRQGMTALDVVLAVGGLGEFASGNRARIVRKDDAGKERTIKVRLADLVNKGRTSENVPMRPGDVLIVPESKF